MRVIIRLSKMQYSGIFVADSYRPKPTARIKYPSKPRLCAAATARIFKLGPGCTKVRAVFTKNVPRLQECRKWYEIGERRASLFCPTHYLKGFRGGFMGGVSATLTEAYNKGYRYVRVEKVS